MSINKASQSPHQQHFINNIKAHTARLAKHYKTPDNSVIYQDNDHLILRTGDIISLYFIEPTNTKGEFLFSGVMSSINLRNPLELNSVYSQALMLVLIFNSNPKTLYMLGFGGGIVPMSLYHYLPKLTIEGSELNDKVVALSQSHFGLKLDERMNVVAIDGKKHLAQVKTNYFDIILLDTFTGAGRHPDELATSEFYQLCLSRLKPDGVIATNLIENDPKFIKKYQTFCSMFNYVYTYQHEKGNVICYGSNTINIDQTTILRKATILDHYFGFHFPFKEHAQNIEIA